MIEPPKQPPPPPSGVTNKPISGAKKSGCLLQILLMSPVWTGIGGVAAVVAAVMAYMQLTKSQDQQERPPSGTEAAISNPDALFSAIRSNRPDEVKRILIANPHLCTAVDSYGNPPLLMMQNEDYPNAIQKLGMANALLDGGCDPNAPSLIGYLPIHFAVMRGETNLVGLLIKKGADLGAKGFWDETVMHCLAKVRDPATLNELFNMIMNRAPDLITIKTSKGDTPLHYAADQGNLAFAKLLFPYKIDPRQPGLGGSTAADAVRKRIDSGDGSDETRLLLNLLTEYEAEYP